MQIQERIIGNLGVLRLAGRLTVNEQPGLLKQAITSLVRQGARHVILDLGGVLYIDSTRLGELIAAHVMLSRGGGRLLLAAVPVRVLELLVLSSLDGVFERFDTVDEAEASITSAPA